jgi:hypothetical protein
MSAGTPPPAMPHSGVFQSRLSHLLATTAIIVLTLGVLPLAWDASVVWQVIGPLVALGLTAHTTRVVWQTVFSTDPRHLGTSG